MRMVTQKQREMLMKEKKEIEKIISTPLQVMLGILSIIFMVFVNLYIGILFLIASLIYSWIIKRKIKKIDFELAGK